MLDVIHKELYKAFSIFNQTFFNNELPGVVLTIQSSGHQRNAMGWCTTSPVWGDREGQLMLYEINIAAEYLDLPFTEQMDTLLHEMIHLYHNVNNIKDTSRNNTYHNKHFKNMALKIGFEYESDTPDKLHGWSYARLSSSLINQINNLDIDQSVFNVARKGAAYFEELNNNVAAPKILPARSTTQRTKKPTSYKWTCPKCNQSIRSTKKIVHIVCGNCNVKFIRL